MSSENILNSQQVIRLNKLWQAYEVLTVRAAFTFLCSQQNGEKPGFAIDYETIVNANGDHELVYTNVVGIDEWMKLPIRDGDEFIGIGLDKETGMPKMVRVPRIVICANYNELPKKKITWSPAAVRERDKGICQITKVKLAPEEGDTGHIIAKANGGKNTWDNTIYMRKDLNRLQGTKTPAEMGWRVPKPKTPMARVRVLTVEDAIHPSQKPFLLK